VLSRMYSIGAFVLQWVIAFVISDFVRASWFCFLHERVAPLRMGVRRAVPGNQVLSYFVVISCP